MLRAFIAIDISSEVRMRIRQVVTSLQRGINAQSVRWVAPENIHLTLKFLGDVSPSNLDLLKQVVAQEAALQPPFDLIIRDLGCFPTLRHPRVLWAGVAPSHALEKLQRGIDQSTARLGYASDARPFSPHLTLGRVTQHASLEALQKIREALENEQKQHLGTIHATEVILFHSDLRPSGPQYTPLYRAPLGVNS